MKFVFGSYNLEYGGIDNGSDARLRRQLKMLANANADVWALQECSNWQENGALYLAEQTLHMRGFVARSSRSPGGNLVVMVREALDVKVVDTRHEEKPPYWHGVALVVVELVGFGPLRLASAHLAPMSPALRLIEAEAFGLIAERPVPLIAGGDWNAIPTNDPLPDVEGIHRGKARRKKDWQAAASLEEYMTDVGAHLHDSTSTVGHTRNDKLAYRCDRIYTTLPPAVITGYQVIHESAPESDHRPVLATFAVGNRNDERPRYSGDGRYELTGEQDTP